MEQRREKSLKVMMIVLSILLALSATALGVILLYNSNVAPISDSAAVTDNVITPKDETEETSAPVISQNEPAVYVGDTENIIYMDNVNYVGSADRASYAVGNGQADNAGQTNSTGSAGETGREDKQTDITLYKRHAEDNEAFQVANMFPGDMETKYFRVQVFHKGDVLVHYHADIHPGCEKLAEVLKCRITLLSTGETLYDGLMRDMPSSLDQKLTATDSTNSVLEYEICAYLDTSVGNEYMNQKLAADFRWWVEETRNLDAVKTGDTLRIWLWAGLGAVAVLLLILLWIRRPKEVQNGSGK